MKNKKAVEYSTAYFYHIEYLCGIKIKNHNLNIENKLFIEQKLFSYAVMIFLSYPRSHLYYRCYNIKCAGFAYTPLNHVITHSLPHYRLLSTMHKVEQITRQILHLIRTILYL